MVVGFVLFLAQSYCSSWSPPTVAPPREVSIGGDGRGASSRVFEGMARDLSRFLQRLTARGGCVRGGSVWRRACACPSANPQTTRSAAVVMTRPCGRQVRQLREVTRPEGDEDPSPSAHGGTGTFWDHDGAGAAVHRRGV